MFRDFVEIEVALVLNSSALLFFLHFKSQYYKKKTPAHNSNVCLEDDCLEISISTKLLAEQNYTGDTFSLN